MAKTQRKSPRAQLHAAAVKLRETGPRDKAEGICDALRELSPNALLIMRDIMEDWPQGTGNAGFPVPADKRSIHSLSRAIDAYYDHANIWDRRHSYGRLRWELLDYIISETAPRGATDSKGV